MLIEKFRKQCQQLWDLINKKKLYSLKVSKIVYFWSKLVSLKNFKMWSTIGLYIIKKHHTVFISVVYYTLHSPPAKKRKKGKETCGWRVRKRGALSRIHFVAFYEPATYQREVSSQQETIHKTQQTVLWPSVTSVVLHPFGPYAFSDVQRIDCTSLRSLNNRNVRLWFFVIVNSPVSCSGLRYRMQWMTAYNYS